MDYLPPQSIGNMISDFKKEAKSRGSKIGNLPVQVQENLAIISKETDDINEMTDELHVIEAKLSGGDVREKVRAINKEIQICTDTINKSNRERDKLNVERGGIKKDMERADSERQHLTLLDESNKKIQRYLIYAKRIYDELESVYQTSEAKIRDRLQNTINDIFKQIYAGGLSLSIDSKYHITVQANDYDGDVDVNANIKVSHFRP